MCRCDCEKIVYVTSTNLKSGNSRSCGCYAKEVSTSNIKKNKYELSEDGYYIGITTNTGNSFYFDIEDFPIVEQYTWREDKHGYIVTDIKGIRSVRLHRLLCGCLDEMIDHKNGDTKDNRRKNLRPANAHQNQMNRVHGSNSFTGIKGVTYRKDRNNYFARIKINGKQIHLGTFKTIEEAAKARNDAENKLFGEFSLENSRGGGNS